MISSKVNGSINTLKSTLRSEFGRNFQPGGSERVSRPCQRFVSRLSGIRHGVSFVRTHMLLTFQYPNPFSVAPLSRSKPTANTFKTAISPTMGFGVCACLSRQCCDTSIHPCS
ncbi:hypothetical protein BABINDRAFT_162442 [Babjeviella inositovora NRRL Y-12698]|uniref:Uncharacterized protein n=1 Tax=Babjeviella inositovora NRRL Y-12698 TaxID=984486 RepID=A0A1E3QM28_9ASCO|nr:uncharacterized protein BABINDRAFT_162442 [Babjeviella inositovora NRRL Y-12698]ODQ78753.1 hypothetical protein BABINDRAFT_162442 [Babjeviella inositovora NRRL Y-12698]